MAANKRCIGFGEFERKCTNEAGTPWSPHWCERCNKLRMVHITKQMEDILAYLDAKAAEREQAQS